MIELGLYKNIYTNIHYNLVIDDDTFIEFTIGYGPRQKVYYHTVYTGFPVDFCVECLI